MIRDKTRVLLPQEFEWFQQLLSFAREELHIPDHIAIDISITNLPEGRKGNVFGLTGDHYRIELSSRHSSGDMAKTLCHEMIHVKQFVFNNLQSHLDNPRKEQYINRWWEKEAFELGPLLFESFVASFVYSRQAA